MLLTHTVSGIADRDLRASLLAGLLSKVLVFLALGYGNGFLVVVAINMVWSVPVVFWTGAERGLVVEGRDETVRKRALGTYQFFVSSTSLVAAPVGAYLWVVFGSLRQVYVVCAAMGPSAWSYWHCSCHCTLLPTATPTTTTLGRIRHHHPGERCCPPPCLYDREPHAVRMTALTDLTTLLEKSSERLSEYMQPRAFRRLQRSVIERGACVECGTCIAVCPEDALAADKSSTRLVPRLVGKCTGCGLCYASCPRTVVAREELLGESRQVIAARARDRPGRSQDGGAVTRVLEAAITHGTVDAAVVVGQDNTRPWRPVPTVIRDPDCLEEHAGTVYSHAPVVGAMLEAFREGAKRVAVVGTACDIDAVNRLSWEALRVVGGGGIGDVLTLGLFCMHAFDYDCLSGFLASTGVQVADIRRMSISGGTFSVSTGDTVHEWELKEISGCGATSCKYCRDLTCKGADISFGNVGSPEGWTTVIVRTVAGERALRTAIEDGLIETTDVSEKGLRVIERLASTKAMRYR